MPRNVELKLTIFSYLNQPNTLEVSFIADLLFLCYNNSMFLSKEERKDIMASYGYGKAIEKDYRQVGPDTWIYLFELENTKYILIVTDYLGDYDFDVFPHLLKFEEERLEFVLQQELSVKNPSLNKRIHANTILFEYTD